MITDLSPFEKDLEGLDLTDAQKLDLLNALWVIAENIIDHHLGLNRLIINNKEATSDIDSVDGNATLYPELSTG